MKDQNIDVLVRDYGKKVYNLAYRLLGNRQDAEDITQETFMQIHRSLTGFRGESAIYTWIYRITVNNCLQVKRRLNKVYIESLDEKIEQFKHDIPEDVSHWENDPEKRYLYDELLRTIQSECYHFMTFRLTDEQRVVYILRVVLNFSLEDISRILQVNRGIVKARVQRAKNNLRSYFSRRCQWILGDESPCSCKSRIGFAQAYAPDILKNLRNYERSDKTENPLRSTLGSIGNVDEVYKNLPDEDFRSDVLMRYIQEG
jgi:RNA polymerase sigma factor (sigma-70 family)